MSRPRDVYPPRVVAVVADAAGNPRQIGETAVDGVREDWLVEDRWWTAEPLRRRYFEVVLTDGRDIVVFHDLLVGRWLRQHA